MPTQPARVLVVDDDKNQRNMLVFALENCGYQVSAVGSGPEALAAAADREFDAAICDIMMPGMDGVQTLERLKTVQPSLRVIMATGHATPQTAVKSKKLGAFNYLAKPYEMKDLLDVLSRALQAGPETT